MSVMQQIGMKIRADETHSLTTRDELTDTKYAHKHTHTHTHIHTHTAVTAAMCGAVKLRLRVNGCVDLDCFKQSEESLL